MPTPIRTLEPVSVPQAIVSAHQGWMNAIDAITVQPSAIAKKIDAAIHRIVLRVPRRTRRVSSPIGGIDLQIVREI